MHEQGKSQDVLKCPAELQKILGRGRGYITAEDGMALRHWVDGGGVVDQEVERARGLFLNAAEQGLDVLRKTYQEVPQSIRDTLGQSFMDSVVASARAFDEGRAQVTDPSINNLNRQIASQQINDTPEPAATPAGDAETPQSQGNDGARSESDAREINGGVHSDARADAPVSVKDIHNREGSAGEVGKGVSSDVQSKSNETQASRGASAADLDTSVAAPDSASSVDPVADHSPCADLSDLAPLKLRDKQQLIRIVNGLSKEKIDELTAALIAKFGFDNQTQMSIQLTHQSHADFIHAFIKGQ